ncbi:hypothetical protein [Trichlorobacter ammonificans]|uniref:Uncharacterized protein n=1 Tax=Trichlorobacter ammonificans TaxID=2916410 RepID=A0ABM9D5M0_9BACT|nr:hypothetical protein [Trichlorobacter ammonificans]CAH2030190.1 protein of unknown function [Trichlorobacter ammonificans]
MTASQRTGHTARTALCDERENEAWLRKRMSPYFFQAMADEPAAVATLARELGTLRSNRRLILADRHNRLILACVDQPGSLYESMRGMPLKYRAAILAAEIGASLGCSGNRELDFEEMVRRHLARMDRTGGLQC